MQTKLRKTRPRPAVFDGSVVAWALRPTISVLMGELALVHRWLDRLRRELFRVLSAA